MYHRALAAEEASLFAAITGQTVHYEGRCFKLCVQKHKSGSSSHGNIISLAFGRRRCIVR